MDFLSDICKNTVQLAAETYKDNSRVSAQQDDKAQKTVTLAGIFLAAAFGFLKPDQTGSLLGLLGLYASLTVFVTIGLFLVCLGMCLSVMWVRKALAPLPLSVLDELNNDILQLTKDEITETVAANYYREVFGLWEPILKSQVAINKIKGRRLWIAQMFLATGMLSVAGLLFSLLENAIRPRKISSVN